MAQLVKNLPAIQETWVRSLGEGNGYPLQYSGLENSMDHQESACQCRKHGFDHWVRKISWSRKRQPAPVYLLGKYMDRRVTMSQERLSD